MQISGIYRRNFNFSFNGVSDTLYSLGYYYGQKQFRDFSSFERTVSSKEIDVYINSVLITVSTDGVTYYRVIFYKLLVRTTDGDHHNAYLKYNNGRLSCKNINSLQNDQIRPKHYSSDIPYKLTKYISGTNEKIWWDKTDYDKVVKSNFFSINLSRIFRTYPHNSTRPTVTSACRITRMNYRPVRA